MPVRGVPAFNAVALLEIEHVTFANKDVSLVAHAAFVNTDNGSSYGHTTCRRWSKETIDCLNALKESMERDCAAMVFTNDGASGGPVGAEPGGLGEHAGTEDAEQV